MPVIAQNVEPYETQYINNLKYILNYGKEELNKRTGIRTKRVPGAMITVDLAEEFPILKSKRVYWKTAAREIMWIMQSQSNNVKDFKGKIWDSWADENGSIGKAYGYQVGREIKIDGITYPSQVHYVLEKLENDPSDRRGVINLWGIDDLNEMNLVPCCYSSVWNIIDGKLNCTLMQRSADYCVGVPFNTTQYAILTYLFARHLGVEPGRLTHMMADAHVYCYDSHIEGAKKMIKNFDQISSVGILEAELLNKVSKEDDHMQKIIDAENSCPSLLLDESFDTDFFSMDIEKLQLKDYNYVEEIKFDVAE